MLFILLLLAASAALAQSPEQRAADYLAAEVRAWRPDNGCFSCHNNGDGARALYAARMAGLEVTAGVLDETADWLRRPGDWDDNQGEPGFSDQSLARVQWAATLTASGDAVALAAAVERLAADQTEDGSWPGDAAGSVGSPATWGRALRTAMALRAFRAAGSDRYAAEVAAAEAWLAALEPRTTPEAAALVFALSSETGRRFIRDAQASDGGWGPYPNAPSEVFDTALAVLALDDPGLVEQGKAYLRQAQLKPGGWLETTRPSGSQSYAQHISTTAWALMALLKDSRTR